MLLPLIAAAVLTADAPRDYDAFLESRTERPLTEGLRPEARALLAHSLVTATEPRRGVPTILWAEQLPGRSPREQGLSAPEAARQHLLRYTAVYRLRPELVARLVVSEVHEPGKSAVVVGFAREHGGLPVLRDELDVVMTWDYRLVAFTGSLATQPLPSGDFRLSAATALAAAGQHLTGALSDSRLRRLAARPGGWTLYEPGALFASPPRVREVYFDDGAQLLPAFHMEVETAGRLHAVVLSAVDGRLLCLADLEAEATHTYRAWAEPTAPFRPLDSPVGELALPHPTGVPDGFAPAAVAPALVTLAHAGSTLNDDWLPSGASELAGNNARAYADLAAPDGLDAGDLTVVPSSGSTFDYSYDLGQPGGASSTQRAAAATHAFFVTNWLHDAFYELGFDEQARNGQNDNYGRGGLGGDAVNVEVQDYAGRNNASFRTRADGEPGRMQLFLFDEPRPSTATFTTASLPDGGAFLAAPPAVTLSRTWDVTGPVQVVRDLDGGYAGCDPWADAGSYAGAVVLVDGTGCSVGRRFDFARDAGAAALVLSVDGCFAFNEGSVVATCVEPDAGTRLLELAAGGDSISARLTRPPGALERDVALDSTVVAHEFTHFVTGRLVGDSLGLLNSPARAMGEGWSDFVSLWLTARDSDTARAGNDAWQGAFAIGGWVVGGPDWDGSERPAHYFGFRRYPYSTDRAKNPLTFKHVGTNVPLPALSVAPREFGGGPDNAQVHNAGEVWASMLWDAQVALFKKPGATVEAARATFGGYLVASLKATPVLPTFLEARDALLAVVAASSRAVDLPLVQDAFARRGLGVLAMSSDRRSTTNTPLAEDFTGAGGNYKVVSLSLDDADDDCDADGFLDANETGTLTLTLMNVGTRRLSRGVLRLSSSLSQLQLSPTPVTVPPSEPFTTVSLTVPVSLGAVSGFQSAVVNVSVVDPDLALPQGLFQASVTARLNVDLVPSMTEGFENDAAGWSFDGEGAWPWEQLWFVRALTPVQHALTGRGMDGAGTNSATTPPLAVGPGPFSVTFTHSYLFETDLQLRHFDGGRLELSTDGVSFTPVPGAALSPTYPVTLQAGTSNPLAGQRAYGGQQATAQAVTADFGTQYANRTVWLRWTIGADDARGTTGWTIDEVVVNGVTTAPFQDAVPHRGLCVNHPPTISGTSSLSADERSLVTLVPGTVVDRDGDTLTFTWMQTSGPSVQLLGDTFTAPEVTAAGAILGFRVTVDDGRGGTATDSMVVAVRDVNRPPEVSAPATLTVVSGATAVLEAMGSDPDGDALTYLWAQEGEESVTLKDANTARASFVAPEVEVPELISFRVLALDASTASPPATVVVTITPKPTGCGCSSVEPLFAFALLLLARRRARR